MDQLVMTKNMYDRIARDDCRRAQGSRRCAANIRFTDAGGATHVVAGIVRFLSVETRDERLGLRRGKRDGLMREVELGLLIDAEARIDRALAAVAAIGRDDCGATRERGGECSTAPTAGSSTPFRPPRPGKKSGSSSWPAAAARYPCRTTSPRRSKDAHRSSRETGGSPGLTGPHPRIRQAGGSRRPILRPPRESR